MGAAVGGKGLRAALGRERAAPPALWPRGPAPLPRTPASLRLQWRLLCRVLRSCTGCCDPAPWRESVQGVLLEDAWGCGEMGYRRYQPWKARGLGSGHSLSIRPAVTLISMIIFFLACCVIDRCSHTVVLGWQVPCLLSAVLAAVLPRAVQCLKRDRYSKGCFPFWCKLQLRAIPPGFVPR